MYTAYNIKSFLCTLYHLPRVSLFNIYYSGNAKSIVYFCQSFQIIILFEELIYVLVTIPIMQTVFVPLHLNRCHLHIITLYNIGYFQCAYRIIYFI